jgi:hypothetical protein
MAEISGASPYPYNTFACTLSTHHDHDATDVKARFQKIQTNLPDVLQTDFSKIYL